jgi:DNA primase
MRFPPHILDDIRARLPTSVVVGRRVKLQKAGREWKGLSPFNAERTPSFFVNDQKGQFFDFSSGKTGDIFTFVMETEGLSFPDAVERLAGEAGVQLPEMSVEAEAQEARRKSLHEVCELAARFFEAELQGPRGGEARRYLTGRQLAGEPQKRFRLGFAPGEKFALRDHLAGKGVAAEDMIEAGLLIHGEDIAVPYDRFRNRVMFPIADVKGRVIAFGGRALEKDAPAKYLNSPETPLFHKGSVVYNHHAARKAAHDAGTVIAVEGYVDVIAVTMAGLPHAVAPLGTALTDGQLALLWRMAPEPILCFDGDKAGKRAAFRAVDTALPLLEPGKALRFVFLPEGQDPDDLLRSAGAQAVRDALARTEAMVDVLWRREIERAPLDTPERRADFERRVREAVGTIRDETLKKHYRAEMEARVRQFLQPASGGGRPRQSGGLARARRGPGGFVQGPPPGEAARMRQVADMGISAGLRQSRIFSGERRRIPAREAALVTCLVHHPFLLEMLGEEIAMLRFASAEARGVLRALLAGVADGSMPDRERLVAEGLAEALDRLAEAQTGNALWTGRSADSAVVEASFRNAMALQIRVDVLHTQLGQAEREFAASGSEASLEEMRELSLRLGSLDESGSTAGPGGGG